MKRFLISASIALGVSAAELAIPAKPGRHTFTQPDGTTVTLQRMGDEHFHTLITTDGLAVSRAADGSYKYMTPQGVSAITAHNPGSRTEAEARFLEANAENVSATNIARKAAARRRAAAKAPAQKASQVPNTGSPRVPILLVAYKDYDFRDGANAAQTFTDFFSSGETSARQYFADQSNGKYTPQFDIYGPITLDNNRVTYGGNDYYGDDKGVGKMVAEACQGLNSKINFKDYDNDGDGMCDVVIVLYAGDGEASSYEDDAEDSVWPMRWSLSGSDYGKNISLDGVTISDFAVFNELNGSDLSQIDGIGTFCHEFSHCLGLPDFYDTNYSGNFGMGSWSLMDQGSYNDDGYTPIGYSAYEKEFMGWIEIEEATPATDYTLPVFNQKNIDTDRAVRITNDADPDEYYILENRAQQGWDKYIATEGMMITHVTYDAYAWTNNEVNDYADPQRMTLIPADNDLKMDKLTYYGEVYYVINDASLKGDLWPYGGANELTDESVPAAKVNTGNLMGKPVTDITRNNNGTVSFRFMKAALPAVSTPALSDHTDLTTTGFTANWAHTPETGVTYTLEITTHRDITYEMVLDEDFTTGETSWTAAGSYEWYGGVVADGIKLGASKKTGSVTSPSFKTTDEGLVTVHFNSKSWTGDAASAKISLLNAAGTAVDTETVALTESYADYCVTLSAPANQQVQIKFETVANKKRFYITRATVYTGDATELAKAPSKAPAESGDATARTITGITDMSHTVTGLTENGVFDYRVKAVPANADEWNESAWSETRTVDLSAGNSAITIATAENNVAATEYFTLQGVKVNGNNLTPGIYIRRTGSAVEKVMVR